MILFFLSRKALLPRMRIPARLAAYIAAVEQVAGVGRLNHLIDRFQRRRMVPKEMGPLGACRMASNLVASRLKCNRRK